MGTHEIPWIVMLEKMFGEFLVKEGSLTVLVLSSLSFSNLLLFSSLFHFNFCFITAIFSDSVIPRCRTLGIRFNIKGGLRVLFCSIIQGRSVPGGRHCHAGFEVVGT